MLTPSSPSGPLKDLYTNKYDTQQGNYKTGGLKFPLDLGSSRYGHWINFTAMVPSSSKYQGMSNSGPISQYPTFNTPEKYLNNNKSLLNNVSDLFSGAANIGGGFGDLARTIGDVAKAGYELIMSSGKMFAMGTVALYTPDSISLNQAVAYNSISKTDAMGTFGKGVEASAQAGSIYDAMKNGDGTAKQSLMGTTFKNPMAGEAIGAAGTAAGIFGQGASKHFMNKSGYAVNPQMEVIFEQVKFREYQFTFTFTPKTSAESDQIKEIIKFFRFHQLPELDQGGAGRYFIVPSFFQLDYIFNGSSNAPNLHKFQPAVLKSVFVDYAPNGWATYDDAFPVQTIMVLQFQEIKIMTKEEVELGY